MSDAIWLHIGTPKSGTSSLQSYFSQLNEGYVSLPGKSNCNDLAIAVNKKRPIAKNLADKLNQEISLTDGPVVLSSEMFYGWAPDRLYSLLPVLLTRPLNILVYLRRQDRYIEAMYLQKSKNGRFRGSIFDYISKFKGSGSDYAAQLDPWMKDDHARLVPRIMERDQLVGGDVVTDACSVIGLATPTHDVLDVNVSPGYHRVQLLQAAAEVGLVDPRRLQRRLAAEFPQKADERGSILSLAERRDFLDQYTQGNEKLRAIFFPEQRSLFNECDLNVVQAAGIPAFTDAQLLEITRFLTVIKKLT